MQSQGPRFLQAFCTQAAKQLNLRVLIPVGSTVQTRSVAGLPEREQSPASDIETTTISDILASKGSQDDGSWLWCTTEDTVFDAVKSVSTFLGLGFYYCWKWWLTIVFLAKR